MTAHDTRSGKKPRARFVVRSMLTRPHLLLAAAIGFCSICIAADKPRLNLISIVTDDQAEWSLGCYGNKESITPNMDRIAKEGARFANAFTVTPVCSPSRVTFMTGRIYQYFMVPPHAIRSRGGLDGFILKKAVVGHVAQSG